MMRKTAVLMAAGVLAASAVAVPARGAVTSASAHGFESRHSVSLVVPPEAAWQAFLNVQDWWSGDHSWSGKAANLKLDPVAGGCWCEALPNGGSAEHLRVLLVEPGKKMVLSGGLGPLNAMAASGSMIVEVERIAGGSRVTLTYRVAGLYAGNGAALAPAVDAVLAEQVKRYRAVAVTAKAPDPLDKR